MNVYAAGDSYRGRRAVAARNQAEAARLLGISVKTLREFGRVNGHPDEIEAALKHPGVPVSTRGTCPPYGRREEGPFEPEASS